MTLYLSIYITLIGQILGSFYNVVALRVPAGESRLHPSSQCPTCHTWLKALFRVLSYLLSRPLPLLRRRAFAAYPSGEAATGLLFRWNYLQFGFSGQGITRYILISLAVIMSIADLKVMLIPNKVLRFFLRRNGCLKAIRNIAASEAYAFQEESEALSTYAQLESVPFSIWCRMGILTYGVPEHLTLGGDKDEQEVDDRIVGVIFGIGVCRQCSYGSFTGKRKYGDPYSGGIHARQGRTSYNQQPVRQEHYPACGAC